MKKDVLIAVEINDTHLKFIQARLVRGCPQVMKCAAVQLPGSNRDQVQAAMAELVGEMPKGQEELFLILPRRMAVVKQLVLPSHSDHEIRRMIDIQLASQLPYSRDDIIFDYFSLGTDNQGYTRILVVVMPREIVVGYLDLLSQFDLSPHKIIISSLSVFEMNRLADDKQPEAGATFVICVDYADTEFCICSDQNFIFSRSVNFGLQDLTKGSDEEQEQQVHSLIEQIGLTLSAYHKEQMGKEINRFVVLNGHDVLTGLTQKLEDYFLRPFGYVNPYQNILCGKDADLMDMQQKQNISFCKVLGAVVPHKGKGLNLVPPEILHSKHSQVKRKALIQFLVSFAIMLVLAFFASRIEIYKKNTVVAVLKKQATDFQRKAKKAEDYDRLLRTAIGGYLNRIYIADMLKELFNLTPEKINLRVLSIDVNRILTIQGFSPESSGITQFQNQLVASPFFKEVTLQYATKRKRFHEEYTEFKLSCRLQPAEGQSLE